MLELRGVIADQNAERHSTEACTRVVSKHQGMHAANKVRKHQDMRKDRQQRPRHAQGSSVNTKACARVVGKHQGMRKGRQ